MSFYKIFISISTIIYAYFILSYPISYYNDDSLFFVNGIINFSVIDFSPHFPGYVSIVLLGKFINFFLNDAKLSFFILSSSCAIFLPYIIYLYVEKLLNKKIAFMAFCLSISSAYLVNFALSMLSDSIGLFFIFLSLYLFESKKYKISAISLCIAFFARPSYFVFFFCIFFYILFIKKEHIKDIVLYFSITFFLFLLFIYASNDILFIQEGYRFIYGHFNLWGIKQNTSFSWIGNIFSLVNLPYILIFLVFFKYEKKFFLLYLFFISYLIWVINFQNPDNLRHLIPLIFIANIFIAQYIKKINILFISIVLFNISFIYLYTKAKLSPIDQISQTINNKNALIITNRSIEILRNKDFIVIDKFYKEQVNYYKKSKNVYIITNNKNEKKYIYSYKGRFIGEHEVYLYFYN